MTQGQVKYSPEILAKGQALQTYPSTLTDNDGTTWPVTRCSLCHDAILQEPGTAAGHAYHLITHHGYRMDGRNEQAQQDAAAAAAERGEMNGYHRP